MKIKSIEVELEDQEILYILTDVLETNAIGYWSQYQNWKRVKSKDDNDGLVTKILIKELNEDETGYEIPHTIDKETVIKGVNLILKGEVDAPTIREMILKEDIDSDGSDSIITLEQAFRWLRWIKVISSDEMKFQIEKFRKEENKDGN